MAPLTSPGGEIDNLASDIPANVWRVHARFVVPRAARSPASVPGATLAGTLNKSLAALRCDRKQRRTTSCYGTAAMATSRVEPTRAAAAAGRQPAAESLVYSDASVVTRHCWRQAG